MSLRTNVRFPLTWTTLVNMAVGISLICLPYAMPSAGSKANDIVMGIIIFIVALVSFLASETRNGAQISWINVLAGIELWCTAPHFAFVNVAFGFITILAALASMAEHYDYVRGGPVLQT